MLIAVSILIFGLLVMQSSQGALARQRANASRIGEVSSASTAVASAPSECLTSVRDFITYISREKPDIASDRDAQNRWLSQNLRRGLAHRLGAYRAFVKSNPDSPEGPPNNGDFVGSWDYPSIYSIIGSRRYGDRALVDIMFTWGKKTQYPGDTRLVTYVLVREDNAWKLDDIYTLRGKFVEAGSLSSTFAKEIYP